MPAEKITLITGGNKGLGYETRALIRDPERADGLPAGVDRAIGDLDHPGTLAPALKGVDRVFHMQASHGTEQTQAMVEAARQAGLRHIVALSSMGAAGPWPASANGRPTRSSASGHESWMSSKPGSDGLQANRGNPEPGRRFARPWGSIRRAARSLVAPFVESLKDSHLGWHLHTLAMPAGEYLHYNALTVDTYPTWTALGQGMPGNAWQKVHPDLPVADYLSLVNNTVERYRVDVLRVLEIGQPK